MVNYVLHGLFQKAVPQLIHFTKFSLTSCHIWDVSAYNMICPESPRHLAYVCDGIVEVHSEALHQEDPRPRVCLMDSAGCHQSAYCTALMLRPGFSWAASSQDPAWWRLLVLAHVCLTQDSFTSQLSISHRSGWNFSKLLWTKALPP